MKRPPLLLEWHLFHSLSQRIPVPENTLREISLVSSKTFDNLRQKRILTIMQHHPQLVP